MDKNSKKFLETKAELDYTLYLMDTGQMKYYTIDEAEKMANEFLAKYGNIE